jgi:hypothetical protein
MCFHGLIVIAFPESLSEGTVIGNLQWRSRQDNQIENIGNLDLDLGFSQTFNFLKLDRSSK